MKYTFLPEAWDEFEESARYYSSRLSGLELRFIDYITASIALACESPGRFRRFEDGVRRVLTPTFPFGILFLSEADRILILAIMHCARKPGYWKRRL